MSESMERRLTLVEYLKLRLHLLVCAWCARYLKQIKFLQWMLRQRLAANRNGAALALSPEARERIAKSLHRAKQRS